MAGRLKDGKLFGLCDIRLLTFLTFRSFYHVGYQGTDRCFDVYLSNETLKAIRDRANDQD